MIKNILICPDCSSKLLKKKNYYYCFECKNKYPIKNGIPIILPSLLDENKIKEDKIYNLKNLDNSWYNNRIWYYFIHLSSHIVRFENQFLPKIKGPRVLELASGNGWASMLIKRAHPDFEVYSTDVSFNSLKIQGAQMSKIMEVKPDSFVVCDAEKLPFEDNSFDNVFVIASLHHFLDIPAALKEAKRVLKPNGHLIAVDGMMPKFAQKLLHDVESYRTKRYGIIERKITYNDWINFLHESNIPLEAIRLNYDTSYLHTYATNDDEKKLIKKSWIFNSIKEILYGGFLSRLDPKIVKFFGLIHLFPAGIVIEYKKPRNQFAFKDSMKR